MTIHHRHMIYYFLPYFLHSDAIEESVECYGTDPKWIQWMQCCEKDDANTAAAEVLRSDGFPSGDAPVG